MVSNDKKEKISVDSTISKPKKQLSSMEKANIKRSKTMKQKQLKREKHYLILNSLMIILLVLFVTNLFVGSSLNDEGYLKTEIVYEVKTIQSQISFHINYYTRLEINDYLQNRLENNKNPKEIFDFYNRIIRNEEVTFYLIHYAFHYDIPLHLFMALSWAESRFNPRVINRNKNNSYDYGVMQLNSNTFGHVITEFGRGYIFSIKNNIDLSGFYFRDRYNFLNAWPLAIMAYNCGIRRVKNGHIPESTVYYMSRILEKEREFDRLFNEFFNIISVKDEK